jgi:hypothetical protein
MICFTSYDDSELAGDDELLVGDIVDEKKPENVAAPAIEALSRCDGERNGIRVLEYTVISFAVEGKTLRAGSL